MLLKKGSPLLFWVLLICRKKGRKGSKGGFKEDKVSGTAVYRMKILGFTRV